MKSTYCIALWYFIRQVDGYAPPCNYDIKGHYISHISKMIDISEDNLPSSRSEEVSIFFEAGELQKGCGADFWFATGLIFYCMVSYSYLEMWEVINAYMILHNVIIESECKNRVMDYLPYDGQGPLPELDD
jgi:hypothetical protein